MQVDVKLFATLRDGRFKVKRTELVEPCRVIDVINRYKLPLKEVAICLVNGRDADSNYLLQEGDTVSIFPPVGGG
ncbi:MAG: MoaD/ThiS family protein [Methylocystaceae bacterium]